MIKHESIELLKGIDKKELQLLGKFLRSPYFNHSPISVAVFNTLRKHHPQFRPGSLSKKKLHSILYPSRKYKDGLIRYDLHNFANLVKKYLVAESFKKDASMQDECFRTALMERDIKKLYYKLEDAKETKGDESFLDRFKRLSDRFYYEEIYHKTSRKSILISETERLKMALMNFTGYIITESFQHSDQILNYSIIYNLKQSNSFVKDFNGILNLNKAKKFLLKYNFDQNELLFSYILLLNAFLNFKNETYYYSFRNHLIENGNMLKKDDAHFLFAKLCDYCLLKLRVLPARKKQFSRELLQMYNFILDKNITGQ